MGRFVQYTVFFTKYILIIHMGHPWHINNPLILDPYNALYTDVPTVAHLLGQ
jgi:hypothetical protein